MPQRKTTKGLLGLGLDNKDGHVRITRGPNFQLLGGSQETHESMQEKCIRFNEKLTQRGKDIEQLEHQELLDVAAECDMNLRIPDEGKADN